MSLPHALLTVLLERDSSGSDLAARFDRSIGFYWHATHQQIYRELSRLEAAGWIASLPPEPGQGRKRVYRALPAGREELQRWAGEARDPQPLREELMVRVRAAAVAGSTSVEAEIRRRLDMHRQKLAMFRELEASNFLLPNLGREAEIHYLTLKAGIMVEEMWIAWSEQALAVLQTPVPASG